MGTPFKQDIGGHVPRSDGRRYEAVLRLSEALSTCREPEELTKILSRERSACCRSVQISLLKIALFCGLPGVLGGISVLSLEIRIVSWKFKRIAGNP